MKTKIQLWITCAIVLLVAGSAEAEIIETKYMKQSLPYITKDTLVIFDIDNTLVEPTQELGSDEYFSSRVDEFQKQGISRQQAYKKAIREWTSIQSITQVKLCEPGSDKIIKDLQENKIVAMGLTTRGLGLSTRTVEQLETLGIDLTHTAPTNEEIHFMNANSNNEIHGVLFRGGVLFTAGTDKGAALCKFLAQSHYCPKKIVFINDKAAHIQEVEKYCDANNIPFIGIRYGYTDEKVKNFRREIADIQREHFGHIISDEAAEKLLQQKNLEAIAK